MSCEKKIEAQKIWGAARYCRSGIVMNGARGLINPDIVMGAQTMQANPSRTMVMNMEPRVERELEETKIPVKMAIDRKCASANVTRRNSPPEIPPSKTQTAKIGTTARASGKAPSATEKNLPKSSSAPERGVRMSRLRVSSDFSSA